MTGDVGDMYCPKTGISLSVYNSAPAGVHGYGRKSKWVWFGISTNGFFRGWTIVGDGKDNYLFMDGHVEALSLEDPNLNRYVYNEIPNLNNPYR